MNQLFKLLPHGKVTKYLTYKLKEVGVEVKLIDESYTSVADSCDRKAGVTKESKGNGRRIKRGLFLSPIKGLVNADVNGARNILRKFKKKWFDLVTGLKRVVKVRIYKLSEGISESLLYAGIGVEGGVNPPRGIRTGISCQTSSKAPSVRAEQFTLFLSFSLPFLRNGLLLFSLRLGYTLLTERLPRFNFPNLPGGGFSAQLPDVVEFSPSYLTEFNDFYLFQFGAVEGKGSFYSHPVGLFTDCEAPV